MLTILSITLKLLGLTSWAEKLLERQRVKNEGRTEQQNADLKAQVNADEKEIADMRAEKNFADFIAAHPDSADGLRVKLNARPKD